MAAVGPAAIDDHTDVAVLFLDEEYPDDLLDLQVGAEDAETQEPQDELPPLGGVARKYRVPVRLRERIPLFQSEHGGGRLLDEQIMPTYVGGLL